MKRIFLLLMSYVAVAVYGQPTVMHSNVNPIKLLVDGREMPGGWRISPQINPDEYVTTKAVVAFVSDCDSLSLTLNEWESRDFAILTADGDTANVRVTRRAANPYENPSPGMRRIAPSGLLSREQAEFDIRAMMYSLDQIHPDIFSVCRQEDLMRAVNKAIASLPDSLSAVELYRHAAPLVAMIGDGHTNLIFPSKNVFTDSLKRMPLGGTVRPDKSFVCTYCIDSIIPAGSRILSINGIAMSEMIDSMLPYVSGEKKHFRISRVNTLFPALQYMLYNSDEYSVSYIPEGAAHPLEHVFAATPWAEIKSRRSAVKKKSAPRQPYSYSIDRAGKYAVMDFREFSDTEMMTRFADSMFRELNRREIPNLIIDIRNNGGGNSNVGDVVLRYISREPYIQMDKAFIKVTPLTVKLMGHDGIDPQLMFFEMGPEDYIRPLTDEDGHYTGQVYLLTSNHTFSSAGSFAWAFKQCGMGTVIGEETGGMNVCFGDVLNYRLPVSNLGCSVSFKRFWQFKADENDIHGTIPDIEVPADKALDKAIEMIMD